MGESRPTDPPADPPRQVEVDDGPSPLQKAWADYREHTAGCDLCGTSGGGMCKEGAEFWATHQKLCDDIYAALAAERDHARF